MGVAYRRTDRSRGGGPGALAIGAALIAGLLFVGGAIYVVLLGDLQASNSPGTSPIGAIDTPLSSLPVFVQPTPTPTPGPTPSPTLPWYITPSPSFSFGLPTISPTPGIPTPVADFRGAVENDGLTVDWTDMSTGQVYAWAWDFGDGYGSQRQAPTHTYSAFGDYNVTLTVTGPGGSNSTTRVLHLVQPPTAAFTCSVEYLTVACQVTDSSGQIDNYSWDWGDNKTSSGANRKHPSHTYKTVDQFTITLTVSNSGGSTSTSQQVTTIQPTPSPTPSATPPPTLATPTPPAS